MTINYNATDRKPLVNAISEFTGDKAVYLKMPTYAYRIGSFVVSREGNLVPDDTVEKGTVDALVSFLAERGFIAEPDEKAEEETGPDEEEPDEPIGVCISMPRSLFTETAIENLKNILTAKGSLIRKALGVPDLSVEISEDEVSFPWFSETPLPEELKSYNLFICKLCEMARTQKRVSAKEKPVDNEKYAFRCFLLRLGFIGAEYKRERRILLSRLSGSSAFKSGKAKEDATCQ